MNCFASEDELNEYESYIEVRRENIKYRSREFGCLIYAPGGTHRY